jgi:DNA-binding response OmpR family regulator
VPKSSFDSRILVVDDYEGIRNLLTELLTHDGHGVDAVESADEAIRLLLRSRYALLITDLEMPDTSGVELIQEVRGRGLRLPILAIGSSEEAMRDAAVMNLGLAEYLPKPFVIADVREAVARLLAAADAESDTPTPRRYSRD